MVLVAFICGTFVAKIKCHKPVSDWLEMLPLDSTALNMSEYSYWT